MYYIHLHMQKNFLTFCWNFLLHFTIAKQIKIKSHLTVVLRALQA